MEILITQDRIAERIKELGRQITEDYRGRVPVLVGILKGSFVFLADLIRAIDIPVEIAFLAVSSYEGETESSGIVKIEKDIDYDIAGRDLIIVEDIVDTGLTLRYLEDFFSVRHPGSVRVVTLLHKAVEREEVVTLDYVGFEIPNVFVVGYGLDYGERYRNLPYVAVLSQEEIANSGVGDAG